MKETKKRKKKTYFWMTVKVFNRKRRGKCWGHDSIYVQCRARKGISWEWNECERIASQPFAKIKWMWGRWRGQGHCLGFYLDGNIIYWDLTLGKKNVFEEKNQRFDKLSLNCLLDLQEDVFFFLIFFHKCLILFLQNELSFYLFIKYCSFLAC